MTLEDVNTSTPASALLRMLDENTRMLERASRMHEGDRIRFLREQEREIKRQLTKRGYPHS